MAAVDGLARSNARSRTRREPMDWDDVRVFLAIARKGSMRAAGRALGLSQPTIARRLAAFEATFGGATLFDRLPEGLRLNAAGQKLVPAAESVENAALTLERRRAAASPALSGTVRVSTGECAAGFLARCLSERDQGAAGRHHPRTGRLAADEEPAAARSRYGAAVTHRRRAVTSMSARPAPSPARSTGGAAPRRRPGSPIPTSRHSYEPARWVSGRSRRPDGRWRCAPRRC